MSNQGKRIEKETLPSKVRLGHANIQDLKTCKEVLVCFFNQIDPDKVKPFFEETLRMVFVSPRLNRWDDDVRMDHVDTHEMIEGFVLKLVSLYSDYQQAEA